MVSSSVLGEILADDAEQTGLGDAILAGVRTMNQAVGRNTHLGSILLLAPLARVPRGVPLQSGVQQVLRSLTPEDSRAVYEAIRLARPGGLGKAEQHDIHSLPPASLLDAMRFGAERDLIARQYAEGFAPLFQEMVPLLQRSLSREGPLVNKIVDLHLRLMAAFPDSLIARKNGTEVAQQAADWASQVLLACQDNMQSDGERELREFDSWLRADGHQRNPGTTADHVAALLFVALREGWIDLPIRLWG